MEDKLPCQRHDEQIKTLFEKDKLTNKRLDSIDVKVDNMTDMKIAINSISLSMEHMLEHNKRQDELNERQNTTLDNINQNLNELNEGQRNLNNKVEKLERRVDENEEKHNIDTRDIDKDRYVKKIYKIMTPIGIGAILTFVVELFKILKG